MADERMMSAVTMINTAQWNCQKVDVVMALTQVRAFYYVQKKNKGAQLFFEIELTHYCHP